MYRTKRSNDISWVFIIISIVASIFSLVYNNNCEYLQNDFVLIDRIVYAEKLSDNTPLSENLYRKK